MHVLFVCTGNICRSATAERVAATYAARLELQDFTASSAGTRAMIAHPIHPNAARVLETLGGDATDFAARQLTPAIASNADLILTMARTHRDVVLEFAPHRLHRTFTLREAAHLATNHDAHRIEDLASLRVLASAHDLTDIPDPIGRGADVFSMVGSQIADLLTPILELCRRS